ncbi:hypothetical protein UFOVP1351_49 [uncultured Caudovirales phage]|uniref:Uncharacterized protein n=1 Tax=uncultured Caudovirales phage TaxID=2100421 RepID=A0A6J5RTL9_9CAUD|nr:hypothetical protein UFOVP1351_49 [uncultured Caudovirales phage]
MSKGLVIPKYKSGTEPDDIYEVSAFDDEGSKTLELTYATCGAWSSGFRGKVAGTVTDDGNGVTFVIEGVRVRFNYSQMAILSALQAAHKLEGGEYPDAVNVYLPYRGVK